MKRGNSYEENLEQEIQQQQYKSISCRYYEQKLPKEDDLVVAKIYEVDDTSSIVLLPEYNNIKGMILSTEISQKRIKSVHKILKEGKEEVLLVLKVDPSGSNIDLSKRKVPKADISKVIDRFNSAKSADNLMKYVAVTFHYPLDELYQKCGLLTSYIPVHTTLLKITICKNSTINSDNDIFNQLNLDPEIKNNLIKAILLKMPLKSVGLICEVEVKCFGERGILAIKEALNEGLKACGTENVEISLVAPPIFSISTVTTNKEVGIELLNKVANAIQDNIVAAGGKFSLKYPPQIARSSDSKHEAYHTKMPEADESDEDGYKVDDDEISDD